MRALLVFAVVGASSAAFAGETTFVFESREDASTPPDAAVCAAAPFAATVRLGASLWSLETSRRNGRVEERKHRIGRATACLALTNVLFPEGLTQQFFAKFDLPGGSYTALGTCTVASNAVPQPFIILAGCTLKLTDGPRSTLGGLATSSSVFNPLQRPGFWTGSVWTLHEYTSAPQCGRHHDHGDD